jgi:hypothetical protein
MYIASLKRIWTYLPDRKCPFDQSYDPKIQFQMFVSSQQGRSLLQALNVSSIGTYSSIHYTKSE